MWIGAVPTCVRPCHVGLVEVRLAIVANELAVGAIQRGSVRPDFVYLSCFILIICREDCAMRLLWSEALGVPCDNVAAKTGGEGSAEGGGRSGTRLLEVWRDGDGVREDVACYNPCAPRGRKHTIRRMVEGLEGQSGPTAEYHFGETNEVDRVGL